MTRCDDSPTLPAPAPRDELYELIVLAGEGELSEQQVARLEEIVTGDEEAAMQYALAMHIQAGLWRRLRGDTESVIRAEGSEFQRQDLEGADANEGREIGESSETSVVASSNPPARIPSPSSAIILDTSELPSPISPLPAPLYVSHPFLFSNFVSLLILAVGALGAWFYQIDIPHPATRMEWSQSFSDNKTNSDRLQFVARVTGMADVQWADVQTATVTGANVPLGRKYALSSGLLEISYDTGATVILQGPVVYQVDSIAAGSLSVGKLTARLEKRGEGRGEGQGSEKVASGQWLVASETNPKSQISKSQISNPQSQNPTPFVVRTPTATVTDLGTEFGIEVRPDHQEDIVVLQGKVAVAVRSTNGVAPQAKVLLAGQAVHLEAASAAIQVEAARADVHRQFVRALPRSAPLGSTLPRNNIVADDHLVLWLKADAIRGFTDGMPMGYWNDSSTRHNNMYHASPEIPAYIAGASSDLNNMPVVRFKGREWLRGILDVDAQTLGVQTLRTPFTLLSVVKNADAGTDLVNRGYLGGGGARMAFGLGRVLYGPKNSFWAWAPGQLDTYGQDNSLNTAWNIHAYVISDLTPHRWTWYLNGKPTGSVGLDSGTPLQYEEDIYIGASNFGTEPWQGDIAELMLFDRALTEAELQKVGGYLAGKYAIETAWSAKAAKADSVRTNPTNPQEEPPMKTK